MATMACLSRPQCTLALSQASGQASVNEETSKSVRPSFRASQGKILTAVREKEVVQISRRDASLLLGAVASLAFAPKSFGAILEADEDEELLEKVKGARKERLAKRQELNDKNIEKEALQKAVYRLNKAGMFLDQDDFSGAGTVLGTSLNEEWIKNVEFAFAQVNSGGADTKEAETFTASIANLQASVAKQDGVASKKAYVKSAAALESWTQITGFSQTLRGL